MSCLKGPWKDLTSDSDSKGSARVMGCMSGPLSQMSVAIASWIRTTNTGMAEANLSAGRLLHHDRIWRWSGLELGKKRSVRIRPAAVSKVLLPSASRLLAPERAVTEVQIFCSTKKEQVDKHKPQGRCIRGKVGSSTGGRELASDLQSFKLGVRVLQ